ncbi:sensor histidine kinase [Streptomyces sp. INA 01156]
MQALSTGMLADLRAMEDKHHDEEVLADLLHLDHRTAQAGRLADSVAVLTGARSGRRWARPIRMESILRGAMGRISGYRRVRVHSAADTAVAGHAAEGVMHALAELLDNAANFSPPTAEVHVYVEEVPAGVIVSVEDSGLVMGEAQLRRAERAVSGETSGLGGLTGTRLGLAVVGLARRYGLRVSYRPSARGGTGVLMLVPQDILVSPDVPHTPPAGARPRRSAHPARTARTLRARGTGGRGTRAVRVGPSPAPPHPPGRGTGRPPRRCHGPGGNGPAATPAPAAAPAAANSHSYAAHRAGADLDPDPVPTHESPDRHTDPSPNTGTGTGAGTDTSTPDESPLGLPRRRRGRTLAEAERTRSAGTRATTPRPAPPTAEETRARTARFSSFRQAVRATAPDDTAPCPEAAPCTETDTGTSTGTDRGTSTDRGTGTGTDTGARTTPLDTPPRPRPPPP